MSDRRDLGLRVAYDGQTFSGFQLQPKKPSVQVEIERVLTILFRQKIRIQFTSRTDAGVHAYDQWVIIPDGFELFQQLPKKNQERFCLSMNALLKGKICVWQVVELRNHFHPKKNVEWKEYRYRIFNSPSEDPLQKNDRWWIRSPLDLKKMKKALRAFRGTHDFVSFTQSKPEQRSTKRTILSARMIVSPHPFMDGREITFVFRGTGFLYHMVRTMVGTLIDVGRGVDYDIRQIIDSRDRKLAGRTAPSGALSLVKTKISKTFYRSLRFPTGF